MQATLSGFIEYLHNQLGEPYVWGGQHTKLTPGNYVSIIDRKEERTGGYRNETYARAAKTFCKKRFAAGARVLYGYDCSGLGAYYLFNLTRAYKSDVTAQTMYTRCAIDKDVLPKTGWWVFRLNKRGRATHVGYMVTDTVLIEARGRRDGVVKTIFRPKEWSAWGIPGVFAREIRKEAMPRPNIPAEPEPPETPLMPESPASPAPRQVEVLGRSVNVRKGDSTKSPVLFIAHKGEMYPLLGMAPTGWYEIETKEGRGYISNGTAYTRLLLR